MAPPLFIVGANRSGTTLLRLMLNSHPRIGIPDELNFMSQSIAEHWDRRTDNKEGFRERVQWHLENNIEPNAFPGLDRTVLGDRIVEQATVYNHREVYAKSLSIWAQHHGKSRWGEKTPGNLFYVRTLLDMFPDAQFVHLVRDPRAGVYSMLRTSFFGDDASFNALIRRECLREGLKLDREMPQTQWTRLRYEDLLVEPESTLRSLCSFLGEAYDPAMLRYHRDAKDYMSDGAVRDFNEAALRPIDATKVSEWREHLSRKQTSLVEAICAEEMRELGYALDGIPLGFQARALLGVKYLYWRFLLARHSAPGYVVVDRLFGSTRRRLAQLSESWTI